MRLRSWVVLMTALLTAATAMADNGYPPRTGGNYNGPRWYGYFANNGYVPENAHHTNITVVWATYPGVTPRSTQLSDATNAIVNELAVDARYREKAMVDVGAIVFVPDSNNCYNNNPNAAADFQSLVQTLINDGYLVPNAPGSGTVSAFYVADEPDVNCLNDDGVHGTPNPTLLNGISAIRQNANTTNFPLAATVTKNGYPDMYYGLGLFDWVGLDDYHYGVTDYLSHFASFESFVNSLSVVGGTPQHFILVPLVSNIGSSFSNPYSGGAPSVYYKFLADDDVIGIMPFEWDYEGTGGMVGMPWADSYISVGESIVNLAPYASSGSVSTFVNQNVSGTLSASDNDGDALMFSIVTKPMHGTVSITNSSSGAFTYTPAKNYEGEDSFTFSATDSFGNGSNVATESVFVSYLTAVPTLIASGVL